MLPAAFPSNQYTLDRPRGLKIIIRPNRYEPGRANIAVYNWDRLPAVELDVARILSLGDRFEVRSAQDFFGAPVLSGTFDGRPLRIPTSGLAAASPIGLPTPSSTGPEFNSFVLLKAPRSTSLGCSPKDANPRR